MKHLSLSVVDNWQTQHFSWTQAGGRCASKSKLLLN